MEYIPNPAEFQLTKIPPALLEQLVEDPRAMDPTFRIMLAINVDRAHRRAEDPNLPLSQRLQLIDTLAKLTDAYPKASVAAAGAGGPALSVQIIFNKPDPKPAAEVIEATTVEVKDALPE